MWKTNYSLAKRCFVKRAVEWGLDVPPQPAVKVTPKPVPKTNKPERQMYPVFYPLRQKSGLAAFQVAKLAGIHPSTYANYELCLHPCPPSDEQAILNVLGKYK